MITVLKNTTKLVTDVPFPALTLCGSGVHMNNVEKELVQDFSLWRVKNNRNETSRKAIYKDTENFMEERFQIKPTPSQTPITILDILNTMIGPDVDASIAANSVWQNIIACKGTTRSAQDTCVRSCAHEEFELFIGEQGGSKCYHLSTNTLLYDSARESCRGFGGGSKLATINTGEENEFVRQLLHGSSNTDSVLIGLNDVRDEGIYRWQSAVSESGKEVEWTNWGDAQPTGGMSEWNEDCVILMHDGTWHDRGSPSGFAGTFYQISS